jgi:hypothetical protein
MQFIAEDKIKHIENKYSSFLSILVKAITQLIGYLFLYRPINNS